jgi:hypothetical protein
MITPKNLSHKKITTGIENRQLTGAKCDPLVLKMTGIVNRNSKIPTGFLMQDAVLHIQWTPSTTVKVNEMMPSPARRRTYH